MIQNVHWSTCEASVVIVSYLLNLNFSLADFQNISKIPKYISLGQNVLKYRTFEDVAIL
jgi:hypothetical protein